MGEEELNMTALQLTVGESISKSSSPRAFSNLKSSPVRKAMSPVNSSVKLAAAAAGAAKKAPSPQMIPKGNGTSRVKKASTPSRSNAQPAITPEDDGCVVM